MRPTRVAAVLAALSCSLASLVAVAPVAGAAAPAVRFAYANGAGTAAGTGGCTATEADPSQGCSLTTALATAQAGDTVELATPPATAAYLGRWTVAVSLTIAPAPGVQAPELSGPEGPNLTAPAATCTTATCGPLLTVGAGVTLHLQGLVVANAHVSNNVLGQLGAAVDNVAGGTLVADGVVFSNDFGELGGAIDNRNGTAIVQGSTFSGNLGNGFGGAIFNLDGSTSVTDSTFIHNTSAYGGAIDSGEGIVVPPGTSAAIPSQVSVASSTFRANTAATGAALSNGELGGSGTMSVASSTFDANVAGAAANGSGGAIANADGGSGALTVTTSTFAGNQAGTAGAIESAADGGNGTLAVVSSTFSANPSGDGTLITQGAGAAALAADVVVGSCTGVTSDGGYNVASDPSCLASPPPPSDAVAAGLASSLGGLQANGGPTETIAPLVGSPALAVIPPGTTVPVPGLGAVTLCPAADQRGLESAPGFRCDAGAYQSDTATVGAPVPGAPAPSPARLPTPPTPVLQRIAGPDAIGTAIAVAQATYPIAGSAGAVVLASASGPDALAGGPLAARLHAPILLTPGAAVSSGIDPAVLTEIERLLPAGGTVDVLGGPLALAPGVDTTLTRLGFAVRRLAGPTAAGTAVAVAGALGDPSTVLEVDATRPLDGVAAVPAAVAVQGAVLFTDGGEPAAATTAYLAGHPGDRRFAVGPAAGAPAADPQATALTGSDPVGIALAVAARFFPYPDGLGVATDTSPSDALAAGPLLGEEGAPLLLVPATGPLPVAVGGEVARVLAGLGGLTVVGGPLAVGPGVLAVLSALL